MNSECSRYTSHRKAATSNDSCHNSGEPSQASTCSSDSISGQDDLGDARGPARAEAAAPITMSRYNGTLDLEEEEDDHHYETSDWQRRINSADLSLGRRQTRNAAQSHQEDWKEPNRHETQIRASEPRSRRTPCEQDRQPTSSSSHVLSTRESNEQERSHPQGARIHPREASRPGSSSRRRTRSTRDCVPVAIRERWTRLYNKEYVEQMELLLLEWNKTCEAITAQECSSRKDERRSQKLVEMMKCLDNLRKKTCREEEESGPIRWASPLHDFQHSSNEIAKMNTRHKYDIRHKFSNSFKWKSETYFREHSYRFDERYHQFWYHFSRAQEMEKEEDWCRHCRRRGKLIIAKHHKSNEHGLGTWDDHPSNPRLETYPTCYHEWPTHVFTHKLPTVNKMVKMMERRQAQSSVLPSINVSPPQVERIDLANTCSKVPNVSYSRTNRNTGNVVPRKAISHRFPRLQRFELENELEYMPRFRTVAPEPHLTFCEGEQSPDY